jgi:hypothetical protein
LALPRCRPWQRLVQRFPRRLHGEDSSEFAFVYTKDILEGTPSSAEEDGIEFAVVLKEDPQALGDNYMGMPIMKASEDRLFFCK